MLGKSRSEISTISGLPGIRFRRFLSFRIASTALGHIHLVNQEVTSDSFSHQLGALDSDSACASDPHPAVAARSCFNRELEAELINMSGGGRLSVQIADGELPYTPSGRALTVSSQL